MAYRPSDAFDYAKVFIKRMPLEDVRVRILDSVHKMIWMAAPWRWTIGALPNLTLLANTQDYTVALPADFMYGVTSFATEANDKAPRPLAVEPILPLGGLVGQPSRISFSGTPGTDGTARLLPIPGAVPSPAPIIISQYKKKPTTLTPSSIYTDGILVMDEAWAYVFESGVLWQAYLYADDSRAGTTNYDSRGQYAFTGQRAIFEANLTSMREREKLLTVDVRNVPDVKLEK